MRAQIRCNSTLVTVVDRINIVVDEHTSSDSVYQHACYGDIGWWSMLAQNRTSEYISWQDEHHIIRQSLKRKAADQHLSATQNLLTEALSTCTPDLNVDLPKLESLARVVQRSRAKASGSANHSEATLAADFVLPPICQTTLRDDDFVLFDCLTELLTTDQE